MTRTLDVLAFSPHPDDAEIGCGGALALAVKAGLRVGIADLTAAEKSTRGNPQLRQVEAAAAAEILGLTERFGLGLPDSEVGSGDGHRDIIIDTIRRTRPTVVWAPFGHDRHPDHAATARLVEDAVFLAGVAKVATGPPHRPARLYHYMIHHPFPPSFVSDISAVWEQKAAAIMAYESQFGSAPGEPDTALSHPRFLRQVEARAIHYGAMIGVAHGEPFHCEGPIAMQPFAGIAPTPSADDGPVPYSSY
jgi:N-acetylglucosamine malate deacetylase 1